MKRRFPLEFSLRCYPTWWRDRYGDEMRATIDDLVAEGRSTTLLALSLLRDAIRSRLRSSGMPRTYGRFSTRTGMSIVAATIPWTVVMPFVLYTVGNERLNYSTYVSKSGSLPSLSGAFNYDFQSSHAHMSTATQMQGWAMSAMAILTYTILLVLGVGWAILRSGVFKSATTNRSRMWLRSWLPGLTFLLLIGMGIWITILNAGNAPLSPTMKIIHGREVLIPPHPYFVALVGDLTMTVVIIAWVLSVAGLITIAKRVTLDPWTLRFGKGVSVIVATLTSLYLVAFAVWGIALKEQDHQIATVHQVVASYPHQTLWVPITLVVALAAAISVRGAVSARESWRVISQKQLWRT
ncbi:MAG: hypothetical protein ABI298_00395 [Acidimicrobiales bacterium]